MSRLVSVCCVCGVVYGVKEIIDSTDCVRQSHGYCGDECVNNTPVQVYHMTTPNKAPAMLVGYIAGDKLYVDKELIHKYIRVNKANSSYTELMMNAKGVYQEICTEEGDDIWSKVKTLAYFDNQYIVK